MNIETIVEVLRRRALEVPDRLAYGFLQGGEELTGQLSYAELDRRAGIVARKLRETVMPGDRVLLLYPAGLEFITSFFGCLYAGTTVVTGYVPKRNRPDFRIESIASDSSASMVLTTPDLVSERARLVERTPDLAAIPWASIDEWIREGLLPDSDVTPSPNPHGIAFLQYTSGSTTTPKGVIVSHENLIANLEQLHSGWNHTEESVMVTWLPHFHDMGLIYGLLEPLYIGFPCYWMPPASFLQRPSRWLQAISKYRGTHSAAPNFAYDLCVGSVPAEECESLDLSSWIMTLNAAEPVRENTMRRFADHFSASGFRYRTFSPGYGLAECTLKASALPADKDALVLSVSADALGSNRVEAAKPGEKSIPQVGCGFPAGDAKVAIVDPDTRARCGDNEIGEIWVAGESLAQGYWNKPEESTRTFQATILDSGDGPFLRTGDLGFLHQGQVFVTGRLKELIIINGVNHYPQDIERTVEGVDSIMRPDCGAAFSIEVDGSERLVIVQELVRTAKSRDLDFPSVGASIREAVAESHDLPLHAIVLIRTASIPKTSSGKIQRSECRSRFLDESLKVIWSWPDAGDIEPTKIADSEIPAPEPVDAAPSASTDIESSLRTVLSPWLKVPASRIDLNAPFARYGIDSVTAVRISGALASWLNRPLPPTLLYDYPTARSLASFLAEQTAGNAAAGVASKRIRTEPIAIVGMGCRFPGADSPDAFWKLLADGIDAVSEVSPSRWDQNEWYDPEPAKRGKTNSRWGGFLTGVDQFDAEFFGISRGEVEAMDPQQRLVLEVAWQALEDAGLVNLAGTQTGVFVGISSFDYWRMNLARSEQTSVHTGTGNALSIAANRLSYFLDLRGPSVAVDTACSSSLVALHQACEGLRHGQYETAIAGGVNLLLSPDLTVAFSQAQMLSPTGRCKTFDADADGYVRGEGCGMVVLKRLADARRDGDRVLAVVRGSAVNQDGRSNGLTAPNGPAQQAVMREALACADMAAARVSYVEAHGTGTSLGDPIELNSLAGVIGDERPTEQPCWVGSVKTNIGHLEAAAGIAGLIKVVLALQNRQLPPHLHLKKLNPHIDLGGRSLAIPTELTDWSGNSVPRVAGVSGFGFGGTNAHVILEEAPVEERATCQSEAPAEVGSDYLVLPLSGRSDAALQVLAGSYLSWMEAHADAELGELCFTASTCRSHMEQRAALVVKSTEQAHGLLSALSRGKSAAGLMVGDNKVEARLAWLFTGQGAQYVGMAESLYDRQPVFREVLDRCDAVLREIREGSLLSVLFADEAALDQTHWTQPALFAVEMGLARLWQSWGVEPDVVLGHSVGQYAAACVAGVFSLEDGLKLLAKRGQLMDELGAGGGMAAIWAPAETVATVLAGESDLCIAAYNGGHTVVSGGDFAVEAFTEKVSAQGIRSQRLQTSQAFHSSLIDPALAPFQSYAEEVKFRPPDRTLICNISGREVADDLVLDAAYWTEHARRPVQFAGGVERLSELGCQVLMEVGPHPVLTAMAASCWPATGTPVLLNSLHRGQAADQSLATALAGLYVCGITADFAAVHRAWPRKRLSLPTYPFQRQRYWIADADPDQPVRFTDGETLQMLVDGPLELVQNRLLEDGVIGEQDLPMARLLLEGLRGRYESERVAADIEENLYQVQWRSVSEDPLPDHLPEVGRWLLLGDRSGVGDTIACRLRALGQSVHCVSADELDLERPLAFVGLLERLRSENSLPLVGVLHLWSLDLPQEVSVDSLEMMESLALVSTLHLVQALGQTENSAKLYLVTRGGQSVGELDQVDPVQAPLWGLGKVIGLEKPDLWGGMVDLPCVGAEDCGERLLSVLFVEDGEDQVALRESGRHVARLARGPSPVVGSLAKLFTEACYLITGGIGALGLKSARWLAERGAGHVVLSSRREASDDVQAEIQRIESATSCHIHVWRADVGDEGDVESLLAKIREELPPLRGIVHAAGIERSRPLESLSADELKLVLRPKVRGGWNLLQAARGVELDFSISYSSIASVWGSQGQGHYAAANAFLDGLAQCQSAQGLPARSINFGPWSEGGMAGESERKWLAEAGVKTLMPHQALAACGLLACNAVAQSVVAKMDWPKFLDVYQARRRRPFFAELESEAKTVEVVGARAALVKRLEQVPSVRRRTILMEHLRHRVAETLQLDPSQIDPEVGFFDLGMNSLTAVEFRRSLEQDLGHSLAATLAMDRPRISNLADFLLGEVLGIESAGERQISTPLRAQTKDEPIAIVGLSCRLPGAQDADAFWKLLQDGEDAISEIPADRWDVDAYYDPEPEAPGKMYTRRGGFISDIDEFDPQLFGISPREAISMDPQQRLVLEVSWEALERAAISPHSLSRSRAGVYIGVGGNEYGMLLGAGGGESIDSYFATGNALNAVAGRLAFALGLEGPAIAVDTACSSSLVALHQAMQGLRAGDCDLALAGGVNVILRPETMVATCRAQMLAPDGHCKTFDATADGYARGEGCGMVVLKRLSEAQEDNDHILGVIRGSAINQDGASSGLTVPSGPSQERVMREALQHAGMEPGEIDYLEAHGTGTSLGDPIEVQAAAAALGDERDAEHPLLMGSVKTNIGHLEAAAGIAGLIKVVLSMQHGVIPRHLHFTQPNPHIPWQDLPVQVVSEAQPWPVSGKRPVAGISSFGFSGTNAHVIVEGPPAVAVLTESILPEPSDQLLTISAQSENAVCELAGRYASWLKNHPDANLADFCFTANTGRAHLPHRLALFAQTREEMVHRLNAVAQGPFCDAASGEAYESFTGIAFLFAGEENCYAGVGGELFATQPVFRAAIEKCDEILQARQYPSLVSVLYSEQQDAGGSLGEVPCNQSALFAVEYALSELWNSWGIVPSAVLGCGVGEYVAACVAGVLELPDALRLVAERGGFMRGGDNDKPSTSGVNFEVHRQQIPLIAGATGELADELFASTDYWKQQAGKPVRIAEGMQQLRQLDCRALVEIGPSGELLKAGRAALAVSEQDQLLVLPGLSPEKGDHQQMLSSLSDLYVAGATVDWPGFSRPFARRRCVLPTYPFARERYWSPVAAAASRMIPSANHQALAALSPAEVSSDDLYEVEWVRQDSVATFEVNSPGEIVAQLDSERASLREQPELIEFGSALAQIEELCIPLAWQSLFGSTWSPEIGQRISSEEMLGQFGVVPRCEPLFFRLLEMFVGANLLRAENGRWEVISSAADEGDASSALRAVARRHAPVEVLVDLLDRCASGLAGVLRGESDPTELLFPGGDLVALTQLYQDSAPAVAMNALTARAVAAAIAELPADATIRVLEIGAGTGATSSYVLEQLPTERVEYVLTDVDSKFLDAAREKFRDYGCVQCELLNIERDPDAQSIAGRRFDIVIAANVLHATGNLRESLANTQKLLEPDGLLLLLEMTQPLYCLDLTFGLTEAWWKFRDRNLRKSNPLISADQWQQLLTQTGWQGAAAIPGDSGDSRILMNQSLVIASNPRMSKWSTTGAGHWLVLAGATDRGERLKQALEADGKNCTLVRRSELGNAAADYDRLLEPFAKGLEPLRGVIDFAIAEASDAVGAGTPSVMEMCRSSCRPSLLLVQALARAELPEPPRLWLVTCGAFAIHGSESREDDSGLSTAQSTVWGLGKAIAREHSEFQCVLVDLDPEGDAGDVELLHAELETNTDRAVEGQVVFRRGTRHVARVSRSQSKSRPHGTGIDPERSYLITGGLGEIGLKLAGWLAERGARHLLLLGRSEASDLARSSIEQWERDGVQVICRRFDVSQYEQLANALAEIQGHSPPLAGVFHLAGVFSDRLIVDHSWDRFEEVFAPKISGAWNLHQLTRESDLDLFVLFSSVSTVLGNTGMANYVAANHFLDGLAGLRRQRGLPGLSINWGPWEGLGMARTAAGGRIADWTSLGIRPLPSQQAFKALDQALDLDTSQVAVMSVDWARLSSHPTAKSYVGLLGSLLEPTIRQPSQRQVFDAAPPDQRRAMLEEHVSALVARVLGVASSETISMKRGFFDLGMDSLRATELRNLLQADFDCSLSATLTFKYPNIEALVDHLGDSLFGIDSSPQGVAERVESGGENAVQLQEDETSAEDHAGLVADELDQLEDFLKSAP